MTSLKNILLEALGVPFELKTNGTGDFYIKLDGTNGGMPLLEKPTSGNFAAVTTDKQVLDPKYLYYVVLNLHNNGTFKLHQHGTTVPHITLHDIKKEIIKFFFERNKQP